MRVGSLFSGYGGLDMAVERYFGATTAWHVEFDKHPSTVLAQRWPGVPNYGDVTAVDWSAVEPVDIITGGYPCQPFSHAGNRKGTNDERHLWPYVADSLRVLRPRLAVFENVAGHLSLGFDTVLADLAALGFDAEWVVVRARDAGAPHRRERLFIVARDTQGSDARLRRTQRSPGATGRPDNAPATADADCRQLSQPAVRIDGLPVVGERGGDADGLTLLPTPAVNDMGAGKTPEAWDDWTQAMRERHGNGNGHGKSLEIEAQRLLPTARATRGGSSTEISYALGGTYSDDTRPQGVVSPGTDFGPYAAAIHRWEQVLGRPAPSPTEPGRDGRQRLSPRFVEWMMGLPAGHVTDTGIPRNAQLKALGNGVVPQQAALALSMLLPRLYGGEAGAVAVADDVRLLPTPTASLAGGEPAPWKPGVQWWRQSRATRNLAGIVTGNTPEWEGGST